MSCKRFVYHFLRFVANFRLQTHTHMNVYTHSHSHTDSHIHSHIDISIGIAIFAVSISAHCGKRPQNAFPLDSSESIGLGSAGDEGGEEQTGPACLHIEWNVPVIPAVRRLMMTTGKRGRNSARGRGERNVDEVESGTCAPHR